MQLPSYNFIAQSSKAIHEMTKALHSFAPKGAGGGGCIMCSEVCRAVKCMPYRVPISVHTYLCAARAENETLSAEADDHLPQRPVWEVL
jgi:hypothetical protein